MNRVKMKDRIRSIFLAIAAFLLLTGCASTVGKQPALQPAEVSANHSAGIRIESVRLSAGGLMLDVRYRVVEREEAKARLDRKTRLTLTDQATGTVLTVPNTPKVGKLRQIPADEDLSRTYWMFFQNPGGIVRTGGKVALSLGDVVIRDLIVE